MKFLSIDYGKKNIGLAVSDESEVFALPFDTIKHSSSKAGVQRLLKTLSEILQREEIAGIVVGLPRDSSGEAGEMENLTREFVAELEKQLQLRESDITISWWDERFSTASVLKELRAAGISQKSARRAIGKESIDARAAAVILQDFLDARKLRASSKTASTNSGEPL